MTVCYCELVNKKKKKLKRRDLKIINLLSSEDNKLKIRFKLHLTCLDSNIYRNIFNKFFKDY